MTSPPAAPPAPSRRRSGGTFGDMVRTVVVLGVVVFLIVFLAKDRKDNTAVKRVDDQLSQTVAQVARVTPFPLLAPVGLPKAWAPTSVSYGTVSAVGTHQVFHVGWVTPDGTYADLEESDTDVAPVLAAYAGPKSTAQGTITVAGRTTALAAASNHTVTLTQTVTLNGRTVHLGVTGGASQSELTTLLESLQPA